MISMISGVSNVVQ